MEVFIGALPRDINIYELICLIEETLGDNSIYELSVMLDTSHSYMSSKVIRNRGFAFVTFQNKDLALECRELVSIVYFNYIILVNKNVTILSNFFI